MQWEQVAYREVVQGYSKRDACLAILIFSVQMGILFGQGWLYTTDLPLLLMASLNLITALVNMGMALGVVWLSGRRELGLHRQCLGKSMAMGILLATVLLASLLAVQMGIYHHMLHVMPLSWLSVAIFTVGVFNEELFFRGILQTRLRGLLPWGWVCSVVTAGLFCSAIIRYTGASAEASAFQTLRRCMQSIFSCSTFSVVLCIGGPIVYGAPWRCIWYIIWALL